MNLSRLFRMTASALVAVGVLCGAGPAAAQSPQEVPPPATAEKGAPSAVLLTGGAGGPTSSYGYFGGLVPLPGSQVGNGWVVKPWVDYTAYNFDFNGTTINAQAPGAEVLLGYTGSSDAGSWGLYVGPRWRNTTFDNNFVSSVGGSRFGVKGEFVGEAQVSDVMRLGGIASYTTTDQYHWLRGRALFGDREGVNFGPEVVFQGNPEFEGRQYGLAVTNIGLWEDAFIGLHGGYETSRGLTGNSVTRDGAYFGVDFTFLVGRGE